MRGRTALSIGAGALLVLGAGVTTAVVAAPHPAATPPGATSSGAAAPVPSTAPSTPRPAATLSPADQRLLAYVRTLPGVDDVTPGSVDEFTDLTCATLRSPKMSPAFYGQILAVERKGYSLTADQANGLLAATARAACPDAERVVDSRGADAATAPVG